MRSMTLKNNIAKNSPCNACGGIRTTFEPVRCAGPRKLPAPSRQTVLLTHADFGPASSAPDKSQAPAGAYRHSAACVGANLP